MCVCVFSCIDFYDTCNKFNGWFSLYGLCNNKMCLHLYYVHHR